jgi:hypothetical protein
MVKAAASSESWNMAITSEDFATGAGVEKLNWPSKTRENAN